MNNKFEKYKYEVLVEKRKILSVDKSNKRNNSKISKTIKEIDEEMDYRDYNEEW